MRSTRKHDAGFTLMELMIVMAIISVLATLAIPSFIGAIKSAREAVLKEDLHVMRAAIDSYTMDKQKAPQSLDDLIQNGYLRNIPEDPMTHSRETWVTDTSDSLIRSTRPIRASTTSIPDRTRPAPMGNRTRPGRRRPRRQGKTHGSTNLSRARAACCPWPALCGVLHAQTAKTITLRLLDGKTGRPHCANRHSGSRQSRLPRTTAIG